MDRLKEILLDFFENNVRRIFWGGVLALIVISMWKLEMKEQAVTLLVAAGGVAISQFQHNIPRNGGGKGNVTPSNVQPSGSGFGPNSGVR